MGEEVIITFSTLFELLRKEKNSDDLQKLEPNFYSEVQQYLEEKQKLMRSGSEFSDIEESATQIKNTKKIIKEIYERREKKIITLAMNKSRTGSNIMNTSCLLEEEKELFNLVLNSLDMCRKTVLMPILYDKKGEGVSIISENSSTTSEVNTVVDKVVSNDNVLHKKVSSVMHQPSEVSNNPIEAKSEINSVGVVNNNLMENDTKVIENNIASLDDIPPMKKENILEQLKTVNYKKVRFLHPVPKFVDPELKEYGPFDSEEMAKLPIKIADVLIAKNRAEEIKF